MSAGRDDIRMWRDAALGSPGIDLLAGCCFGLRYRPHFHEEFVIAAFAAGAQAHRVGRHDGVALPGSVLIIPSGEAHSGEAAERDGSWSYRAFYPDGETLARLASDLFGGPEIRGIAFRPGPLHQDAAMSRRLIALHAVLESATCDPLARQQAFAEAMASVLRAYAQPGRAPRRPGAERRAVRRAIDWAHAHFADAALGVGDLAAAGGLSPYHFMRCFRAETGVTAYAFVVQLRLGEARRLLACGMPPAEVAQAVGFADQSHLTRHFRAAFGLTPGRFAKETRRRTAAGHSAAVP